MGGQKPCARRLTAAFLYDLAPMRWGSVAIRSEMAEIQDCACCRRPTAGLYQLQLGRCTASDPQKPPWRPRRLSQAQRSSLKGSKTAFYEPTRVKSYCFAARQRQTDRTKPHRSEGRTKRLTRHTLLYYPASRKNKRRALSTVASATALVMLSAPSIFFTARCNTLL